MKSIKTALLSTVALLLLGFSTAFAGTVNWGAATDNGIADANGIKLPAGSLLLVGAFDITDAVIQANASLEDRSQIESGPLSLSDSGPMLAHLQKLAM